MLFKAPTPFVFQFLSVFLGLLFIFFFLWLTILLYSQSRNHQKSIQNHEAFALYFLHKDVWYALCVEVTDAF